MTKQVIDFPTEYLIKDISSSRSYILKFAYRDGNAWFFNESLLSTVHFRSLTHNQLYAVLDHLNKAPMLAKQPHSIYINDTLVYWWYDTQPTMSIKKEDGYLNEE